MPISMLKRIAFFVSCIILNTSLQAQLITDVESVLDDLLFVSKQYVSPASDASVYQSSGAWFTTAKALDKFEIDVSLHFNVLPVPSSQESFQVSNSDFSSFIIQGGQETATVPTALGGDSNVFYDFTIDGDSFDTQAFEGVKRSVLFHPYLQASIGVWGKTDLTIRYAPKIDINGSNYNILGGSVKHNISQYFKPKEGKSYLDIALLVSYATFNLNLAFDDFSLESTQNNAPPLIVINQIETEATSWLFQIIASKKWNKFEANAALGYALSNVGFSALGEGSTFLNLFNRSLEVLGETRSEIKGDIGLNYYLNKKFYVSGTVSLGAFANMNVGFHYKI